MEILFCIIISCFSFAFLLYMYMNPTQKKYIYLPVFFIYIHCIVHSYVFLFILFSFWNCIWRDKKTKQKETKRNSKKSIFNIPCKFRLYLPSLRSFHFHSSFKIFLLIHLKKTGVFKHYSRLFSKRNFIFVAPYFYKIVCDSTINVGPWCMGPKVRQSLLQLKVQNLHNESSNSEGHDKQTNNKK